MSIGKLEEKYHADHRALLSYRFTFNMEYTNFRKYVLRGWRKILNISNCHVLYCMQTLYS